MKTQKRVAQLCHIQQKMTTKHNFKTLVASSSWFEGSAASATKTIAHKLLATKARLRRLVFVASLAMSLAGTARATQLFRPVGRGPEVFAFNGVTMSQPLASNPYALNSPKVYLIFLGPKFALNGMPTAAVNNMVASAKAILDSPYLSGLKQYGSDGRATFADFTVDTSWDPSIHPEIQNPMYFETDWILAQPKFSSWNPPPGGDARTSPIYVVVAYGSGNPSGSNANGPNKYTSRAWNFIHDFIGAPDSVDAFSWVFSHEVAERISSGIGGLSEVFPDGGGQIADGEPEGNNFYAWRLNGSGPVVTSYWSVLDQAFIIPDGKLDRSLLVPIWSGGNWTGSFVSLQQGNLYQMFPPNQRTLIDTNVQSYAVAFDGEIFELTSTGHVRVYTGSGTNWTALTGSVTIASSLIATNEGTLYMLASNNRQPQQVWQYSGSGSNWTPITGLNTTVQAIAAVGDGLYMVGGNNRSNAVWQYSGLGTGWTAITGSNTFVYSIASASGNLYLTGRNNGFVNQIWQYSGSGNDWTTITGPNTEVYSVAVAGDVLVAEAANQGESVPRIWQYGLTPEIWIPLTGTNTSPSQIVVQDGTTLYMLAANGGGPYQVWQYSGSPSDWAALTGLNTSAQSISVSANNRLYMFASNNGGAIHKWLYDGTPYRWTMQ